MRSIETSGKTVDDAIKLGLKELGVTIGDVKVDILDHGSPGLFGMFGRLAKVKLTLQEEDDFSIDLSDIKLDSAMKKPQPRKEEKQKTAEPVKEKKEPEVKPVEKPAENTEPRVKEACEPEKKPQPKPNKKPRPERKPREEQDESFTPAEPMRQAMELPPLDINALNDVEKTAYEFISNTTKLMGVDVEIRLKQTDNALDVQMIGDTLGILIGRRGETLDALQYLTSLTVNKGKDEYIRVTLDTENYRVKREETLKKLALRMANKVKKSGRKMALEPMNPYERRVLHSALQNHPYVTTHSEGEEPYRRVVITLK